MRQGLILVSFIAAMLLTASIASAQAERQSHEDTLTAAVNKAALGLFAEYDSAWNQRDAARIAALFTEDADFLFHSGLFL